LAVLKPSRKEHTEGPPPAMNNGQPLTKMVRALVA
jgi:hypothetical protein